MDFIKGLSIAIVGVLTSVFFLGFSIGVWQGYQRDNGALLIYAIFIDNVWDMAFGDESRRDLRADHQKWVEDVKNSK